MEEALPTIFSAYLWQVSFQFTLWPSQLRLCSFETGLDYSYVLLLWSSYALLLLCSFLLSSTHSRRPGRKEMRQWDRWDIARRQEFILVKMSPIGTANGGLTMQGRSVLHEGEWWKTAREGFQQQRRRVEVDGECVRETTASREDYRAAQEEAVKFFLTKSQ